MKTMQISALSMFILSILLAFTSCEKEAFTGPVSEAIQPSTPVHEAARSVLNEHLPAQTVAAWETDLASAGADLRYGSDAVLPMVILVDCKIVSEEKFGNQLAIVEECFGFDYHSQEAVHLITKQLIDPANGMAPDETGVIQYKNLGTVQFQAAATSPAKSLTGVSGPVQNGKGQATWYDLATSTKSGSSGTLIYGFLTL